MSRTKKRPGVRGAVGQAKDPRNIETTIDDGGLSPSVYDLTPCISVIGGSSTGVRLALRSDDLVVGKDREVGLVLTDRGVSRRHAQLVRSQLGVVTLLDLGSTNGSFVNNRRVEQVSLEPGDTVSFGRSAKVILSFEPEPSVADLPETSSQPVLTPRQVEIVEAVLRGLGNAEIAASLGISVRTVTTHLEHMYARLSVSSRLEIIRWLSGSVP